MSSVQSYYAQRNNNVVNVTPKYQSTGYWSGTNLLNIDPRYASVFNVDLSGVTNGGSDTITRLNTDGTIGPIVGPVNYFAIITDPTIATAYPGLEFTVNFNWSPGVDYYSFVDVYPNATLTSYPDYDLLSPGAVFDYFYTAALTLKSNGTRFVVVASAPTTWTAGYA